MVLRNVYNDATTLQRHFGLTPALVRANVRQLFQRMEAFKSAIDQPATDKDRGEPPLEEPEQCKGKWGRV